MLVLTIQSVAIMKKLGGIKIIPIQPISKDLLYMKVADAIHQYIQQNQLKPGDKIPSERALAEQFSIGRNSVREAIRILEGEGILEVQTGRGTFVSSPSPESSIYLKLFRGNYFELLEVKAVLEREAIKDVVSHITKEQILELGEILNELESQAKKGVYAQEVDEAFHHMLLQINHNKSLARLVYTLLKVLDEYAQVFTKMQEYFIMTIPYHRQIWDGLKSNELDKALNAYNKIIKIDTQALEEIQPIEQ